MKLIQKPIITEKTIRLAQELNQYTFAVSLSANKIAAAKELEAAFGVEVEEVKTQTRLGKPYGHGKFRQLKSRKPAQKTMAFKLKAGNKIDMFDVK